MSPALSTLASFSTALYCPTHWVNDICIGGTFTNCATGSTTCDWVKDPEDPYWKTLVAKDTEGLCGTHYENGVCMGGGWTFCGPLGVSCREDEGEEDEDGGIEAREVKDQKENAGAAKKVSIGLALGVAVVCIVGQLF